MKRPGGRSSRIRSAVHQAVVELLHETGAGELSIAEVAERSGVHQATIYRRWGSMTELINEVIMDQLKDTSPIPETGSLRGDVEAYAEQAARDLAGPYGRLFLRAAMVGGGADAYYLVERGTQLQAMLDRHADAPTLLELMELVLAPIYLHLLIFNTPFPPQDTKRLVDRLLKPAPV
ncbi:TetR/AcrR family transcriptional regulator [Streptosporangium sp. NBC_01639]|uniref:TetR/AcrR family transcriptional regulator n=1 Tax=Streptosporangium sp. NBC_01639 TaxID=2975948 RepID=UPI003869DCE8|nr:TetR/AcrR family transcriptional regulator [Streptosporangium sp. NBC_01639]